MIVPFSLTLIGSGAAAALLGRRRILPLTALGPLVGVVLVGAISAAFADHPILAFSRCAVWGSVILLWWGITLQRRTLVHKVLLGALMVIAGAALAESANSLIVGESLFSMNRPRSLFPNTNNLAAAMIPALAITWHKRDLRWFGVFALILLLTASRASLAGVLTGAMFYAIWSFAESRRISKTAIFAGIGVLAASPLVALRIINSGSHGSSALRIDLWQVGIKAFALNPLIGVGPENYRTAFRRFAQLSHERVHHHAHNLVIQVAAEMGALGLIALIALAGVVIWSLVQAYRNGDRRDAQIGAALTVAVIVHGCLDYVYGVPGNLLILLVAAWCLVEKKS